MTLYHQHWKLKYSLVTPSKCWGDGTCDTMSTDVVIPQCGCTEARDTGRASGLLHVDKSYNWPKRTRWNTGWQHPRARCRPFGLLSSWRHGLLNHLTQVTTLLQKLCMMLFVFNSLSYSGLFPASPLETSKWLYRHRISCRTGWICTVSSRCTCSSTCALAAFLESAPLHTDTEGT